MRCVQTSPGKNVIWNPDVDAGANSKIHLASRYENLRQAKLGLYNWGLCDSVEPQDLSMCELLALAEAWQKHAFLHRSTLGARQNLTKSPQLHPHRPSGILS